MAINSGELLRALSEVSGQNEALKPLIQAVEGLNIEIPEAALTAVKGLMTPEAAQNSATLESHFRGRALAPVDKDLNEIAKMIGLEDVKLKAIQNEKSTYKKTLQLKEALEAGALTSANTPAKDGVKDATADALRAEITALQAKHNAQIEKLNGELRQEKTRAEAQIQQMKEDATLDDLISGVDFGVTDAVLKKNIGRTVWTQALAKEGLKAVQDGAGGVKLLRKGEVTDGSDPYVAGLVYTDAAGRPIAARDFLARYAAEAGLLKVAPATAYEPTPNVQNVQNDTRPEWQREAYASLDSAVSYFNSPNAR